jgi:hypothetical protein
VYVIHSPNSSVNSGLGLASWAPDLYHQQEGGGKKGACATKPPIMSPSEVQPQPGPTPAAAAGANELQRTLCSGRCSRRRGRATEVVSASQSRAAPRSARAAGRMRGVGNSIAMATVTSIYPGSNWRKPRGRSRSLPANRTCPSRPTLLASPSPPAPPPAPPSARSVLIGQWRSRRRDSRERRGASLDSSPPLGSGLG